MRYLLLIHTDENHFATSTDEEMAEVMAGYRAFGEAISAEGLMRGGDALQPTSTATVVLRLTSMTDPLRWSAGPIYPAHSRGPRRSAVYNLDPD